jgi:hypothetical protein
MQKQTNFITYWRGQIALKMKRTGCTKRKAVSAVATEQPRAHQRYLEQWNALSPEQRRQLS